MRLPPQLLAVLGVLALLALAPSARADSLSEQESIRLTRGETVIREHTWEPGRSARFIGGVTYTIVDTTAGEMTAMFDDVDAYRRVLPRTKQARIVSVEQNGDRLVELVQGTALVEAQYTIRVRQDVARREVRFWLEHNRPHEIDDAWGFFRIEPFIGSSGETRVLLTYAILVDVGPGIVRELFEGRVRAALLSVPQLVRRYVAEGRHPGY
jgi:ribosome-associated toxin RatA of RatAB toxin-antitoxin module